MRDQSDVPLWRTSGGIVLIGFLIVAGFYLVTEHTAHVLGVLPFLLFLSCPLMHLFMHHGHGNQHGGDSDRNVRSNDAAPSTGGES